jgi:hypothetical protein
MHIRKLDKARIICEAYKNGATLTSLSKAFNNSHSVILEYLKRYFEHFYGVPFKNLHERQAVRLAELYNEYQQIYVQGLYTRQQLCNILKCDVQELEAMFRKYNLHHQWLKTYDGQVTLCNTSKEFRDSIKAFADQHGYKSVRAVAVQAINEFMLQTIIKENTEE